MDGGKRFGLVLSLMASVLTAWAGQAAGQGKPATNASASSAAPSRPAGTVVAVVDLARIFRNHPQVKQQIEAMKQELTAYEKEVVASRQSLSKQREQLSKLDVGTPAYKQTEEKITRQMSDLQVRDQLKKKEVLEREARIYFDMYDEVQGEVAQLAKEYGISLVLRFESNPIEPTDRNSVQAGISRNVVFQRNLDLTPMILERLGATDEPPKQTTANRSSTQKKTTLK